MSNYDFKRLVLSALLMLLRAICDTQARKPTQLDIVVWEADMLRFYLPTKDLKD